MVETDKAQQREWMDDAQSGTDASVNLFGRLRSLANDPTARKSVMAIGDQVAYGATNFLTTIIIARAAGNTELGLYSLGLSLILIGLDLQNSLILIPYTVYYPRLAVAARPGVAGSSLLQTLALGGVVMLSFGLLGSHWLQRTGLLPTGLVSWGLMLAVPLLFLRQHARMVSFAHLRIGGALLVDGTVGALQLGTLIVMTHTHALTSAGQAYLIMAVACGLGVALWLWQEERFEVRPRQAAREFMRNWPFSKWLVSTTPVAILRSQLGLWLLTFYHGAGMAGYYSACQNITALANPFLTGANNLIASRAAHLHAQEGMPALRRVILRATLLIGLVMGGFFLFVMLFGDYLVRGVYGHGYAHLGAALTLLAGGVFVTSLSAPPYRGLLVLEHSRVTLTTEFLMFLFQVTGGFWLVWRFGLPGAALAVLLSNVLGTVYQGLMFFRRTRPRTIGEAG